MWNLDFSFPRTEIYDDISLQQVFKDVYEGVI